jgi:hypothetical protein
LAYYADIASGGWKNQEKGFEMRYPFFDVRLIQFLLSIPVYLTIKKNILRRSMHSTIARYDINIGPKTTYPCDMIRTHLAHLKKLHNLDWISSELTHYINLKRFMRAVKLYPNGREKKHEHWNSFLLLAPVSFSQWIKHAPLRLSTRP